MLQCVKEYFVRRTIAIDANCAFKKFRILSNTAVC